jgi:hypothetical protein
MTGSVGKGGRPPGQPKTGGRKKGTPNRSTSALREKLEELGCDSARELFDIAHHPKTDAGLRTSILSLFFRHEYPVPKAVAVSAEEPTDTSPLTLDEALKWAKYILDRFGPNANEPKQENEEKRPKQTNEGDENEST